MSEFFMTWVAANLCYTYFHCLAFPEDFLKGAPADADTYDLVLFVVGMSALWGPLALLSLPRRPWMRAVWLKCGGLFWLLMVYAAYP